ncbi:helix-turn-helix domain-containing protein [Rothia sp. ZJ1223]|uniref:helix-turn-helix domain-containing protein n=1 Tax=Rothia sp. ZJ1223 TaxID=2811098 RepID=UPI00195BB03C|nr:helix-turn-helix domain-containing protein [Rothia sp. ZJ1223]
MNTTEIAEEMHRSRESVSRAISRFVERGVLLRGPRVGRSYTYRLDPSTAWRGKPEGAVPAGMGH